MENILPPANPNANMGNYEAVCRSFTWKNVEKRFSWSETGRVNMAYEAIDRHAEDPDRCKQCCLNFEGKQRKVKISYGEMKELSSRFANVLRGIGVKKGDRVFILLPPCPEYYIAMVGCAKVGAVFGPLFAAQMQAALKDRLLHSGAKALVTTPKLATRVPFKELPALTSILYVGSSGRVLKPGEFSWEKEMERASLHCEIEWINPEDPLYLIYTYGPTGRPKGVVHVHYDMVGQFITAHWVLDLKKGDVLWTTAEPGWITGTVYGAFATWLCGVENYVREGRYDLDGWCRSIEFHRISVWYTSPTIFQRLMEKEEVLRGYDLSSLRHLASVGEPLPSEVVYWARRVFKVPVHDTWWMTETGMIMIANFPSLPIKPGSIGKPFPGIKAAIMGPNGAPLPPLNLGELAIQKGWPSMARQIFGDTKEIREHSPEESWFASGDTAYMDEDGYFYHQGRDDDLIKIAGVVVGPSEVEEILQRHPAVADAGIIGKPDLLRGNSIKAFIALKPGVTASEDLKREIIQFVRTHFSSRIAPSEIEFRPHIPRSEGGSVIRRVLKAWELGLPA